MDKEPVTPLSADEESRRVQLAWTLLEHKYRYYQLDAPVIEDQDYDKLEREYVDLCKRAGVAPTAAAVGIDVTRPCVDLVASKVMQAREK